MIYFFYKNNLILQNYDNYKYTNFNSYNLEKNKMILYNNKIKYLKISCSYKSILYKIIII